MPQTRTPDFTDGDLRTPDQSGSLNDILPSGGYEEFDSYHQSNESHTPELAPDHSGYAPVYFMDSYAQNSSLIFTGADLHHSSAPHQDLDVNQFGGTTNMDAFVSTTSWFNSIGESAPASVLDFGVVAAPFVGGHSGAMDFQYSDTDAYGEEVTGWPAASHSEMQDGDGTLMHEDTGQLDPRLVMAGNGETGVQEQEVRHYAAHSQLDLRDIEEEIADKTESSKMQTPEIDRTRMPDRTVEIRRSANVGGRPYKVYRIRRKLDQGRVREFICGIDNCPCDFATKNSLRKHQRAKHESTARYSARCLYPDCGSRVCADTEAQVWCNMNTHQREFERKGRHGAWFFAFNSTRESRCEIKKH